MVVTLPISSTGSKQPADLPGQAVSPRQANEVVVRAVAQTLLLSYIITNLFYHCPGITAMVQSHRSMKLEGTKAVTMSSGFQTVIYEITVSIVFIMFSTTTDAKGVWWSVEKLTMVCWTRKTWNH